MNCGACVNEGGCSYECEGERQAYEQHARQQQEQQYTIEDECAGRGHQYHGEDIDPFDVPEGLTPEQVAYGFTIAGRCYCGEVRYPWGGPGCSSHTAHDQTCEDCLRERRAA